MFGVSPLGVGVLGASPASTATTPRPAPAPLAAPSATGGSLYTLVGIYREAQEVTSRYVGMRPVHCPRDGIVLSQHPRAQQILRCPFCGYEPTGMDHP